MATKKNEEARLRSTALQTSSSILHARRRADEVLLQAKAALEAKTAELAQSLSMMRATLESTTDGILVVDERGKVTDFNEQFLKLWRMPPDLMKSGDREPLLAMAAERLKKPKEFLANTKKIYATSPPETFDVLEFADGRVFERSSKVQSVEGRSVGRVWSYRDVTERKSAEQAAHISHARFAAIIDQSPVGIFLVDAQLRFQHVNAKALPTFGIDNIIGRNLSEVLHVLWPEELATEIMARFRHTLATGEAFSSKGFTGTREDRDKAEYYDWEIYRITLPDGQQGVVCYFIDITAHMLAQEALRRSEEDLRALANSIPQLAWMAGPDGNIFWYNHGWYDYTGTSLEQMQGWGWQSVHDPKMLPLVLERWKASIESGEPFDMEFPLRGADGVFRWFLTRVNPVRGNDGRVVRWFGTNTDVDKVKRAEEALRDEARILELLNKTGASIAAQLDLQSIVQIVTDAATELTGAKFGAFFYTRTDENGEAFMLFALAGAPREAFEKFGQPRATALFGPTFNGEGPIRSDDILKDPRYGQWGPHHGMPKGHLPVRSYLAMPVVSSSGEVIGGLFFGHPEPGQFTERAERILVAVAAQAAIAIDNARLYEAAQKELIQRRDTETALRQSEQFNRTIIVSSRDCMKTLTLDGVMLWVSEKGQAALCIPDLQAVIGTSWFDFWDEPQDRQAAEAAVHAAGGGGSGHFVGYSPVKGEPRWWDVVVSPILNASGKPETLLAVSRDVTQSKLAEGERERLLVSEKEARERAERETRMKDEFLATLSHELRTPLNAILGWANVLRTTDKPDEISEGLQVIERNARAQTAIIEDLLDMSRIISGNVRLDVQHVDLVPVIKAALESVTPMAAGREIRLTSVLDPFAGPVSGDPSRIQQVLWNLLTNALKFTPKGGRVHVVLERVNSHLEISVSDTGQGISPDFLPHVFDRFRQADATTTRQHRGLGLGLSIVKNLIELHGGTVRAKSPGTNQGSTFTICLPAGMAARDAEADRRHPRAATAEETRDENPDLTGLRILAVDDEADARQLVSRILERCGAEVETAKSGGEALACLRKRKADVLIMDIGMPDEDGYAAIRKVRQLDGENGGNVPAIALTAFARSEDRRRAILAGFQMHMSKPVEPSELIAMVASLAGRTH